MLIVIAYVFNFSGIFVIGGALIDESQDDRFIRKRPSAKAREIFVLKWLMVGFLLTIMYKSVLRSNMIHIKYEKGIDSVEDVLNTTDKKVLYMSSSPARKLLAKDPREKMKELNKRVDTYEPEQKSTKPTPSWVSEG